MIPIAPDGLAQIHEPDKKPDKKPRRKLLFWDRAKLLVILGALLAFGVGLKHADVPIISWADAWRDQLRAKSWVLVLMGCEVLRQVHLLVSEKNGDYHWFWNERIFGGWDRFWGRRNAWLRYRMQRLVKVAFWLGLATLIFSGLWGLSLLETVVQAPKRLLYNPFGTSGFPWFFTIAFGMFQGILYFVAIFWFMARGGVDTYMPEQIKTRFTDVWGQDKVLDKVKENIAFLDKPDEFEARGGYVPSGILLWGPPGTGKTLIAEAIAGETSRPYVFVDPGAFRAMFVGVGIMKVRGLYKRLRKLALKYGGVIVFLDEADTLGNRGTGAQGGLGGYGRESEHSAMCNGEHYVSESTQRFISSMRAADDAGAVPAAAMPSGIRAIVMGGMGGMDGSLQAILTAMSGLKKPKGGLWKFVRAFFNMPPKPPPKYRILHILATNLPEALDPALLRPGRIDRMYNVSYPLLEGRVRTFNGYLDKIRHQISPEQVERLATMSRKVSGAQVKDIVNEALIVAMKKGRDFVTWPDLLEARFDKVYGVSDGTASSTLERYETSVHEACHAVAMYRLRKREVIDVATIEKRGRIGGFVAPVPVEERDFEWKHEMERDVMTFLASLAGERLFFNADNSVGVGGDLGSSTNMVTGMLTRWGMGDTISALSFDAGETKKNKIDQRVEDKLRELYERTVELLSAERRFVLSVAHALLVRETISGEDIKAIDEGRLGVTVDGAWYKNPANMTRVEAFHAAAARAHDLAVPNSSLEPPPLPAVGLAPPPLAGVGTWVNGQSSNGRSSNGHSTNGSVPPPPPTRVPPPPPPPARP